MILTIDIGNSRIKAGIFVEDKLVKLFNNLSEYDLVNLANQDANIPIYLCSVSKVPPHFNNLLENKSRLTEINHNTKIPIANNYSSPQTLGMDRLASAIGAKHFYPNSSVLAIDIGSCITYDFINKNSEYQGGAISPGINLRLKSLHDYTHRLPLVKNRQLIPELIGRDTESSILSGVIWGIAKEIEGTISEYKQNNPDLEIVLSGGDAVFFESMIKASIFVNPNLVLHGLYSIFLHNESS